MYRLKCIFVYDCICVSVCVFNRQRETMFPRSLLSIRLRRRWCEWVTPDGYASKSWETLWAFGFSPQQLAWIYGVDLPKIWSFVGVHPFPYHGSSISYPLIPSDSWHNIPEKAKHPWKSSQIAVQNQRFSGHIPCVPGLAIDVRHVKPVTKDGQSSNC
jgi:hypothetical protein